MLEKYCDVCKRSMVECVCSGNGAELKRKGTVTLVSGGYGCGVEFEIEGKRYNAEEFAKLISVYGGLKFNYQVCSSSEPELGTDEYLVPVNLSSQSLISELNTAISTHGNWGFISYKSVFAFDLLVHKVLEKLEALMKYGNKEEALKAGKELIHVFLDIETDDEYFPMYHLERIRKIVDPLGIDREIGEMISSYDEN